MSAATAAINEATRADEAGFVDMSLALFQRAARILDTIRYQAGDTERGTSGAEEMWRSMCAYVELRLHHLHHDGRGDEESALAAAQRALSFEKSALAWAALAASLEAGAGGIEDQWAGTPAAALEARREMLRLQPTNKEKAFDLAVALARSASAEDQREASEMFEELTSLPTTHPAQLRCQGLVTSWQGAVGARPSIVPRPSSAAAARLGTGPPLASDLVHLGTFAMLRLASEAAAPLVLDGGLVCEFGVASGRSIRMLAELLPGYRRTVKQQPGDAVATEAPGAPVATGEAVAGGGSSKKVIHGFDTFEGLPEAWGDEPEGTYTQGGIAPVVPPHVQLHKVDPCLCAFP